MEGFGVSVKACLMVLCCQIGPSWNGIGNVIKKNKNDEVSCGLSCLFCLVISPVESSKEAQ